MNLIFQKIVYCLHVSAEFERSAHDHFLDQLIYAIEPPWLCYCSLAALNSDIWFFES